MSENEALLQEIQALRAQLREKEAKAKKPRVTPKGQATRALTTEEFTSIIKALREGFTGMRPSPHVAGALIVEANTGMRISDIVKFRLKDIVRDGDRLRLNVIEQKTGKLRTFTVRRDVYDFIVRYCYENGIKPDEPIFPVTPRTIQRQLAKVVDWLGLEGNISTHSFRKWFATNAYEQSGYDISVVKELLQHADLSSTQRYIGLSSQKVEDTLSKCGFLPE